MIVIAGPAQRVGAFAPPNDTLGAETRRSSFLRMRTQSTLASTAASTGGAF
jgi:hypothetical protein